MSEIKEMSTEKEKEEINEYNKDYEILYENYPEYDIAFKIIIIGNSGVGKTCLSLRGTKNVFNNNYESTIAFEYSEFHVKLKDGTRIRLHVWDTCGTEIYRSLVKNYYKNASLAFLVYAVNE